MKLNSRIGWKAISSCSSPTAHPGLSRLAAEPKCWFAERLAGELWERGVRGRRSEFGDYRRAVNVSARREVDRAMEELRYREGYKSEIMALGSPVVASFGEMVARRGVDKRFEVGQLTPVF